MPSLALDYDAAMADAVPHGQRVFNIWTYDRNAPALPVLILHTGDPEPSLKERFGSYAEQIAVAAGLEAGEVEVVPVHEGARPAHRNTIGPP